MRLESSKSIRAYGAPEIVNSGQGSQNNTRRWEDLLTEHGVKVSMSGCGRCKDNIWIERFWRTDRHEYVCLNPADGVGSACLFPCFDVVLYKS